jgi:hypothetical protein
VVPTSIKVKHHIDNQFSLDMGVDTSHMRIWYEHLSTTRDTLNHFRCNKYSNILTGKTPSRTIGTDSRANHTAQSDDQYTGSLLIQKSTSGWPDIPFLREASCCPNRDKRGCRTVPYYNSAVLFITDTYFKLCHTNNKQQLELRCLELKSPFYFNKSLHVLLSALFWFVKLNLRNNRVFCVSAVREHLQLYINKSFNSNISKLSNKEVWTMTISAEH